MPAEIHEITGWMFGLLTHELGDPQSPVRRFFATRFTQGAGAVQEPVQGWCRAPPATMRPWAPRPGAFGGVAAFVIVLVLGLAGYLAGRALAGELDLGGLFVSRNRRPR